MFPSFHVPASVMSNETLQSWAAVGPSYRSRPTAPAIAHAQAVSSLWNMRFVPLLANAAARGRFAGAALTCPVRACTGFGEMGPGAASQSYVNPDSIENIFCLDGTLEVRFGPDLDHVVTLARFDMFSVPANVRHSIRNISPETARLVMVLNAGPQSPFPAVFDRSARQAAQAAHSQESLDALAVSFGDATGNAVNAEEVLSRVSRFASLVPYKKDLKNTAGIPPEATEMLSAGSVYPLIVPTGHVGRSRTAPMYGAPGLYISIAECVPGDDGPPPHSHSDTQENFFVLDGQWDITSGFNNEFSMQAKPHDLFAMPPKVMRSFRNTGVDKARLLVIIQGPDKMNDTVSFSRDIGAEVERRFGADTIESYKAIKMTFDAEERLQAWLAETTATQSKQSAPQAASQE